MTRTTILSALAGALLLGVASAALAATGEFDNMCTEGLALGKDIKTDCSVNATLDGKTYCFGNEAAKTLFMKDPQGNLAKAQAYLFEQEIAWSGPAASSVAGPYTTGVRCIAPSRRPSVSRVETSARPLTRSWRK